MVDFNTLTAVEHGGIDKPTNFKELKPKSVTHTINFSNLERVSAGTPLLPKGKTQEDIEQEVRDQNEELLERELNFEEIDESMRIARDEGTERDFFGNQVSYIDSVGEPTGGIGHLLTKEEQEKYPIGTPIPDEVVKKWFDEDIKEAKEDAEILLKGMTVPPEVKAIITNMAFNLGRKRLSKFRELFTALSLGEYGVAAEEMKNSKWYKQVGNRSKRLVERMRNIKNE